MVKRARKSKSSGTSLKGAIAVAYIRASRGEQKISLEAQRASIEAWASREGVAVASWHLDAGVCSTDAIEERPGLVEALAAVREHAATILVVAKRDRIARDVVLTAMVTRGAEKAGASVVSAAGEGNGASPADAFMRTVIDGAAAYELALIRARVRAALVLKKGKGERTGACPFGMRVAADGQHSKLGARRDGHADCRGCLNLESDPSEQATIARAKALSDQGLTVRAIAARLGEEGHRNRAGKPLAFQAIGLFLRQLLGG